MLKSTIECIDDGIVVVDRSGNFRYFNNAARRILGYGRLDTPLEDWSRTYGCFCADRRTPFPSAELPLARALRGESSRDVEVYVRNRNVPRGAWISVSGTPLRSASGKLAGGAVVFRDITARRRATEAARRLAEAVERTTDSVVITDANAQIEYVNPAFEATTGYARDEVVGQPASVLIPSDDDLAPVSAWCRPTSGKGGRTMMHRRHTGEIFHAHHTVTPVRDEGGYLTHFVSVMRDLTYERKAHAREVEMRLARVIQQKLYPATSPETPGLDLAGHTFPADETCGDYFDFISLGGRRLCIAVGDVSGHGFGPALLMAETRAYLRSLAKATSDLVWIMGRLNAFLCDDTEEERFVTLMLVLLDLDRRSLVYSSAGHVPGFLLDDTGATRLVLSSTGVPLGIFRETSFGSSPEIALDDGDLFVLLTDGATEAQDPRGEFFESKRILETVVGLADEPSQGIVAGLHEAIGRFTSPATPHDDISAVVGKAVPRS
jgi:sigma-B regulation protein RsbU (phosphoserine phosphatase)